MITCDQAIYDIAKGLTKRYSEKYSNLVIRLGGFHIAEIFLGAIGFFMKESGFEDVLVESKICGKGTANKIISGKGYYQMLNCHFLMSEAMVRLKWEAFESWLIEEGLTECFSELAESIDALLDLLETLLQLMLSKHHWEILESNSMNLKIPLDQLLNIGHCMLKWFRFWDDIYMQSGLDVGRLI